MITSETSPSAPPDGAGAGFAGRPLAGPPCAAASGMFSRRAMESSGLVSRTKIRRPFWVFAAAASSGSACSTRARTSSPCSSAPSCSNTAAPGSSTSRYCARPSENSTASKWPVGSDRPMMPILLPVLVRRSMRDTTVAATLPAVAPVLTARENSAQDCTRSRFSTVA